MKRVIIFLLTSCIYLISADLAKASIDSLLLHELEQMDLSDQFAARHAHPPEGFKHLSQAEWEAMKDSIYRSNQGRIAKILYERGFPGYDLVGQVGSQLFWVVAQHADFDPQFQQEVLDSMWIHVQKGNASSRNYAFLTDRVSINTGKKQVYGTQLDYTFFTGHAKPLPTIDPANINVRRAEVGLEPIEAYLEEMTRDHLAMNPTLFGMPIQGLLAILGSLVVLLIGFVIFRKKTRTAS